MSDGLPSPALLATLYASLHTGTPGDRDFYARACAGADTILELGCGTGRILSALGSAKRRVGLDLEMESLRLAKQETRTRHRADGSPLEFVRADMRSFRFAGRFERILLPYTGLYCLADDEEVRTCFERVREHLADDGHFIFDAYCADALHERGPERADPEERTDDEVARIEVDGTVWHVREESEWDAGHQRLDVVYVYEPRAGGHSIADTIRHRYLRLGQLEPLLQSAGLELVSLESAFDGGSADADSDHYVAVATSR